ncbi:MAG: ABC transporter permease [Oscillospiraceae bacterium]|nr:ABC transporter permease [Oscillospiraceae bacterium]
MTDIFRTGIRCMFHNRLRSMLTMIGIAVGVMSVVIVSSIGEIGRSSINNELSGMGMDSLVISVQSGSANRLNEDDLYNIKNLDSVGNAMPLMSMMTEGEIKSSRISCMVWGVNEDADNVIDLDVLYGRLLNKGDLAKESLVCVIDEAIASEQYKRANIVGKTLTLTLGGKPVEFEIVGVVKNGVNTLQNMLGGFIPDFVYIPYSVMQEQAGKTGFDQITVKVEDKTRSDSAADEVRRLLSQGNSDSSYSVDDLLSRKEKMDNIISIASAALSAVAGISLIVSGLSIMTVMLVSVSERTREIGIKKSIGASRGVIMAEFLFESVLITFIGSITGIAGGVLISVLAGAFIGEIAVNWRLCGAILLISLMIGGGFGVYPAFKAAALKPVDALRYE